MKITRSASTGGRKHNSMLRTEYVCDHPHLFPISPIAFTKSSRASFPALVPCSANAPWVRRGRSVFNRSGNILSGKGF